MSGKRERFGQTASRPLALAGHPLCQARWEWAGANLGAIQLQLGFDDAIVHSECGRTSAEQDEEGLQPFAAHLVATTGAAV